MTDGLFVRTDTGQWVRPKSKKMLKEVLAEAGPDGVKIECTTFGSERTYRLAELAPFCSVTFVGPDPYTDRRFYGTISNTDGPKGFVVR